MIGGAYGETRIMGEIVVDVGVTSLRSFFSFQFRRKRVTVCRILSSLFSRSLGEEEEDGVYFGW